MVASRAASMIAAFAVVIASSSAAQQRYTFTHLAGTLGGIGYRDGHGAEARFYEPTALAVDGNGVIYVSDYGNHVVRTITADGDVATLAGLAPEMGFADGRGASVRFHCPYGPAVGSDNTIFLSDSDNHVIRRITTTGITSTIAGSPEMEGAADGAGAAARFDEPYGMSVDAAGNVIVADSENHTIRRVTPAGVVTTIAGQAGERGYANGRGSDARFDHPTDVTVAADGTIYVADENNAVIRRIGTDGTVTTLAGTPMSHGEVDGPASSARFNHPMGVASDAAGNIYIADAPAHTIRRIDASANVSTLAGLAGTSGAADGQGGNARFQFPTDVAVDPRNGRVIVADSLNDTVRVITVDGIVTTLAGAAPERGFRNGRDGEARFDEPLGVAVNASGSIAVSDSNNHVIRRLTLDGDVSTFAGAPLQRGDADGPPDAARFSFPAQLAFDLVGTLYVADYGNQKIRKVASDGTVVTVAGSGTSGFIDGDAGTAQFRFPTAVTIGPRTGSLYVADRNNHVIRRIRDNVVSTVAGSPGVAGMADGAGTAAQFNFPYGIAADDDETLYVADYGNHSIRKIAPDGAVTTLAGVSGSRGYADGSGADARFTFPAAITISRDGTLFVADSGTHTIRSITRSGDVRTIGGTNGHLGTGDGTSEHAEFAAPYAIAVTSSGTLLIAERQNHAIRIGTIAAPDTASIDQRTGMVGVTRQLRVETPTATSFLWRMIRRPSTSTAALDEPTSPTPRFTPDVADQFIFELTAKGPAGISITTVTLDATVHARRRAVR